MEIFLLVLSYLLGSFPSALLIGKWAKGIDIREYGSKNMGGTNAIRVLGWKWGIVVSFLDIAKACLIVLLFRFNIISYEKYHLFHPLIYGFFAIFGHFFPIFARFRGGKGVASTAGVILTYQPLIFLLAAIFFFSTIKLSKYVSFGSLATVVFGLVLAIIIPNDKRYGSPVFSEGRFDYWLIGFLGLMTVLIFISHQKNIARLLRNEERRIDQK